MPKIIKKTIIRNIFVLLTLIVIFSWTVAGSFALTDSGAALVEKDLIVNFINVGQADCILIHTPRNQNILIDAGNREDFPVIRSFLQTQKVSHLDVVVATHPHEDHIGSMEQIVRSFEVSKIYMPKVANNTRVFEDLLRAIKAKGLKISIAKAGVNLELTPGLAMEFLAPINDSYENLNDYSAVLKLNYHKVSFIFTGDAGRVAEQEMLGRHINLRANILKVGHHGSSSSSRASFVQQVAPEIAVISVGINNVYHHPSLATLKRLERIGARIYRTDLNGTIKIITDGNTYTVNYSNDQP